MSFSLNILVHDAKPELITVMRERSRGLASLSHNGTLVVRLLANSLLSHAIYPREWKVSEGRSRPVPDFTNGVVHTVYDFPAELADVPHRVVFEEMEVHTRRSYCQVVTDYDGGKLRPYRRDASRSRFSDDYDHPTASVFSAPKIGLLRWDLNIGFTIQRTSTTVVNGLLTARIEMLLQDDGRCEATKQLTSLPDELSDWTPALAAVLDRYRCSLSRCEGHYHLT